MQLASRMQDLPQPVFSEMISDAEQAKRTGLRLIDLGIGSPDGVPAPHIVQAMKFALDAPDAFGYPMTAGGSEFRQAAADWYLRRFGVRLDASTQVHSLMGSQDGLAHLALTVVNPGDVALMPDPGYPIYHASVTIAGGQLHRVKLRESNGFLPDFSEIPASVAARARLLILNYPNNPLSVTADYSFLQEAYAFAREHDIVLCYDNAYSELAFDGFRPPSLLQVPGATEHCVEFNSLSKAFNMAGCRVAYAVGSPQIIDALSRIKSHIDYGVFRVSQAGAIAALAGPDTASEAPRQTYQDRRDSFIQVLSEYGWQLSRPQATMFVWARIPQEATSSMGFAKELLRSTGVTVIPGSAFGEMGEGYVRMALVHPEAVLTEAAHKIGQYVKTSRLHPL